MQKFTRHETIKVRSWRDYNLLQLKACNFFYILCNLTSDSLESRCKLCRQWRFIFDILLEPLKQRNENYYCLQNNKLKFADISERYVYCFFLSLLESESRSMLGEICIFTELSPMQISGKFFPITSP